MSNSVERVRQRLLKAARVLAAAGIPYAVAGGNAVAAWVARIDEAAVRNTQDVDLLVRRDDFPRMIEALQAAGFVHRRVSSLGQSGSMDIFLDGEGAKVRDSVHVIFANERTRSDQPEPNADLAESEEAGSFQVVSLAALVRMKLSAFLDKDRVHLRDLVEVGLIDAGWLQRVPASLQTRLAEILATPEG